MLPFNDDTKWILGQPNFACRPLADYLRGTGVQIPHRAEDEQAHVMHWMLCQYEEHGARWRERIIAVVLLGHILKRQTIESEADHEVALAHVEVLVKRDPAPDSPDGLQLNLLARIVEAYEKTRWPMGRPAP